MCRARGRRATGRHDGREMATSAVRVPPALPSQLQRRSPPLRGRIRPVCSGLGQDSREPAGGVLRVRSPPPRACSCAGPSNSRARSGSTTWSDCGGPGSGPVTLRRRNDDGFGSDTTKVAETFPEPAVAPTWVTLLGLPKERPDPVELIDHLAQGRLLLDNPLSRAAAAPWLVSPWPPMGPPASSSNLPRNRGTLARQRRITSFSSAP